MSQLNMPFMYGHQTVHAYSDEQYKRIKIGVESFPLLSHWYYDSEISLFYLHLHVNTLSVQFAIPTKIYKTQVKQLILHKYK